MRMRHHLKIWPPQFEAVRRGDKTFEFRLDDRGFDVGDVLVLCHWNPETKEWGGWGIHAEVTYILRDSQFGVPPGYCVMSIRVWDPKPPEKSEAFDEETFPSDWVDHATI